MEKENLINRNTKCLVAGSVTLPGLVFFLFEPTLGIIIGPIILIISLICCISLNSFMKLFKIAKQKRANFIILTCSLISIYFGYSIHHEHSPEGAFQRYVGTTTPKGIEFILNEGSVALAGGSEILIFRLPQDSFDQMISSTEFKSATSAEFNSWMKFWMHGTYKKTLDQYEIQPMHYYSLKYGTPNPDMPDMSGVWIVTNSSKTMVFLCRYKV
jgi:hypothetical protein